MKLLGPGRTNYSVIIPLDKSFRAGVFTQQRLPREAYFLWVLLQPVLHFPDVCAWLADINVVV